MSAPLASKLFKIGDKVKAIRFGEEVRGEVVPNPGTGKGGTSIVFVRFEGSRFTHWMHAESLTPA